VIDLLVDPFRSPYMLRALVQVLLLALLGGVVGVHVLLRRLAFVTEALQHTVFPGIVAAFLLGHSLLLGALAAAMATVVLLVVTTRARRLDQDAVLALLTATAFAVGVVLVSRGRSFHHDLTALLFGRILAVDQRQLVETAVLALACTATLLALHKELVLLAFDDAAARALGYRPAVLEVVLNVVVALVVVAAIRSVGTVLVVAFLLTPAAAARSVTRSVPGAMAAAVGFSAVCGWLGLALSFELSVDHGIDLASGATVVVVMTAGFVLAVLTGAGRRLVGTRHAAAAAARPGPA
jgi:manganese/iron transport system permease protein